MSNSNLENPRASAALVGTEKTRAVPPRGRLRSLLLGTALVLWGFGIVAGFLYGFVYEHTPTATDAPRERWPPASACTLAEDRATLLMFVHPRCPCSRASLEELAVLMTRCRNAVRSEVVFFQPESADADWVRTDLWNSAVRIPGVEPRGDRGGIEHRRFGATVSGEVFLYGPDGELAFHGGITSGRGHVGDNLGRSAIEAILLDRETETNTAPVFGCESTPRN